MSKSSLHYTVYRKYNILWFIETNVISPVICNICKQRESQQPAALRCAPLHATLLALRAGMVAILTDASRRHLRPGSGRTSRAEARAGKGTLPGVCWQCDSW